MNEQYKKTVMKMARSSFRDIVQDLKGFIESRSLNDFGAGAFGVELDSKDLALKVLGFIYEQNCKKDFNALVEGLDYVEP